jgi:hypothetical protein
MPTTPTRAAIYAIYVPTLLWADAGLRARLSFEYRSDPGLAPSLHDLAPIRSFAYDDRARSGFELRVEFQPLGLDPQNASRRDTFSPATGVSVPATAVNILTERNVLSVRTLRRMLTDSVVKEGIQWRFQPAISWPGCR